MERQEICARYNIPVQIFRIYERICPEEKTRYNDSDIERLGMIMTLCDAGFSEAEIERYMNFCKNGKSEPEKCISMLENKRRGTLEKIHHMERQIENIDCLKYKLKAEVMKNE